MKITRLPQAVRDVDAIWRYIVAYDPRAARRQVDRLSRATARLSRFPKSAPLVPEVGANARGLPCDRYIILYRIATDRIDIVRVMHQTQDRTGLLDDD